MIIEILEDSLTYSLKEFSTIIKLGILDLLSFLIFPIFLIQGYSYNITNIGVNSFIHGNSEVPPFENWKNMFINGIKRSLVILIYSIPAIILSFWTITNINNIRFNVVVEYFYLDIGIELTVMILLWIATFIIISAAIPHMTQHNSLKSAFNIRELIITIKKVGILQYFYFVAWWIIIATG